MAPAPDGGLHWLACGEHDVPATTVWMTDAEVALVSGLRFTKRRTEYLLRRWTGKRAVAAATGMPGDPASLAAVEIAHRPSGAPYVRVHGAPVELDVSLTDRAGWAVCVVSGRRGRVGCDLEVVEPRTPEFVADFLTPAEQAWVAVRPDGHRDAAANLMWSAKESALKVLQTGLRRDTRSVEVDLAPASGDDEVGGTGWARLEVRSREGGVMPGWWRRDGDFLVTIAAEGPLPPPVLLPGSADLAAAHPEHSWVARPLAAEAAGRNAPQSPRAATRAMPRSSASTT